MKALCYKGVNKLSVENVKDPGIINPQDVILKVALSSVCGSDLHFIHGYIPAMKEGDIIGHEFVGEVVETGPGVKKLQKGDRVIVAPDIGCGQCFYCHSDQWSLCDNSNQNGFLQEKLTTYPTAAFFGCSHLYGGYAGSHAEYIRIPYADYGCFKMPETMSFEQGLFASDALPTGYMAADMAVKPGDIVAVWGAGAVGQMAMASAWIKGAARVFAIDKHDFRLKNAAKHQKAEVLNFTDSDIFEELKEATGGRGPDVCIDAVGMEATTTGLEDVYDKIKQSLRMENDRPAALRQAITCCRKGGTVSVIGVYSGFVDKFPLGIVMNKGLTLKTGMVHAQKYIPKLIEHIQAGQLDPTYLKTYEWKLEEGNEGYKQFGEERNSILRGVFRPGH